MNPNYASGACVSSVNAYKNQQIMTASPGELTMLLYNGALKFANEAKKAMTEKNYEKANETNIKAQRIVSELAVSLDMQYELSENWARLYEYTSYCLIQANIKRDETKMDEAIKMLREFRDAWHGVLQQMKGKQDG